jgi:phosphate transport system protein
MTNIEAEIQILKTELIKETHLLEMFEEAVDLLEDVLKSFETENSLLAMSIFKRDQVLNTFNKSARVFIIKKIKEDPQHVEECLSILSIIRKLERAGDQSKTIAEQIIFFIDAKVLRHGQKIQNQKPNL